MFESGRFVLYTLTETPLVTHRYYITSFETWEQCECVFPIEGDAVLLDLETGRRWDRYSRYVWEDAAT